MSVNWRVGELPSFNGAEDLSYRVATSLLNLQDVIEYLDLKGGADNYPDDVIDAVRAYQTAFCERF